MQNYSYDEIERVLEGFKHSTKVNIKQEYLRQLLNFITPLIKKKIKHYFGFIDEDMLQCGYVKSIELIDRYDQERGVLFLGYMKRMLGCYFFDERKKYSKFQDKIEFDEEYILPSVEYGYIAMEVEDLLQNLSDKERYIVQNNIMNKQVLKETAEDLDISYAYAKELKRTALQKLRLFYVL